MRNAEEHTQTSLEDKFPLLEIDLELTKVMPPDEVIELVNACVSLSDYARNDIRNAFFRALSIPALDVYVDTDQRCKVAIDIVINGLENRFTDKPKLEYEWKGKSLNLSEIKVIDKYGNGLFTEYWIAEPSELALNSEWALEEPDASEVDGAPEVPAALEAYDATEIDVALKVHDVLEILDAPEVANTTEIDGTTDVQEAPKVGGTPEAGDAPAIPDAQVLNVPEEIGTPDDVNALEVDSAQEDVNALEVDSAQEDTDTPAILDAPEIPDAPEVNSSPEVDCIQVPNAPEDGLAPEDNDAVEVANTTQIPGIHEINEAPEVDGAIEVDRPTEIHASLAIPELVLSSPSPVKKRTKKASVASHNTMILAEILQELKEIKALLKDKQ